jgi:CheY-like chemotaxis protein
MNNKQKLLAVYDLLKSGEHLAKTFVSNSKPDSKSLANNQKLEQYLKQAILHIQDLITSESDNTNNSTIESEDQVALVTRELSAILPTLNKKLRNGKGRKILYLDDNPSSQEVVGQILRAQGYEVIGANDAREAFAQYNTGRCDLLVIDLELPHFDAGDLIRTLRSKKLLNKYDCPILAILGKDSTKANSDNILKYIDHYIKRPFDLGRLMKCIEDLVF